MQIPKFKKFLPPGLVAWYEYVLQVLLLLYSVYFLLLGYRLPHETVLRAATTANT